jgi:hypothetical protein
MQKTIVTLQASDFINYSSPIELLPSLPQDEFYYVEKIIWKYRFGTSAFDYSDKILFKIGEERIATMQADVLSSLSSTACVSNCNLCIDKECPKINLSEGLKLHLTGTPPTQGNGVVIIEISFAQDGIWLLEYST